MNIVRERMCVWLRERERKLYKRGESGSLEVKVKDG